VTGRVFEIREFCLHDGPGPRTTVFLQGCPLRCTWCQNPEGQDFGACCAKGRIPGEVEAQVVVDEIAKTADFLALSGGGVTFSGGEPLAQADFICEILDLFAARGLKLTFAVETSGCVDPEAYRRAVPRLDLVLQDVKFATSAGYRRWTGVEASSVFENLAWLKTSGVPFVARIPTMPGVNDSFAEKDAIAKLLEGAPGLQGVELLPYNRLAGSKYAKLGRTYAPGFDENKKPDLSTDAFAARGLKAVAL